MEMNDKLGERSGSSQDQVSLQSLPARDQSARSEQPPSPAAPHSHLNRTRPRAQAKALPEMNMPSKNLKKYHTGNVEEPKNVQRPAKSTSEKPIEDENCLYFVVRQGKVSLQLIVDDWIESYKVNREEACLSLMQFIIDSSGCKGKITPSMHSSMELTAILRKMTEEFHEESAKYPLIMTGQAWKKFRSNFCDFVGILIKQCRHSIIYDQYLVDNLVLLLTHLSDSHVRTFRHTATLAVMKLMTALVDVALEVSFSLDNMQRLHKAEQQKTRNQQAADGLQSLALQRQELEENIEEIKSLLTYLFKSVFVHRYRDIIPEIRAICMAEIGVWMKKFHQFFLDDMYLKYIGWTLHDKVGEVRLKCVQALQPLYASEELVGKLQLFTSKFKNRIVSMTLDKDYDVAVQAVKLVISIHQHHRDILLDKDCEHMYELVFSSHHGVAQAAGKFLNKLLCVSSEEAAAVHTKRGKKRLPNTPLIRNLVKFFIESEHPEHGAYLVDALMESNTIIKDWECMTDLLLEEPGITEETLDYEQETSLVELMVCSIKQVATGELPVGRGPIRKVLSTKEIRQVQDDRISLTEHFIFTMPLLLDKYRTDRKKLSNLLTIPQYFDLNIYTSSRQEGHLDKLLEKFVLIVKNSHDSKVLETCSKTLELLCTQGSAIFTRCDIARRILFNMVTSKYKEAVDKWRSLIEGEETPDEDVTFSVLTSIKKISVLSQCHNVGQWDVWDSLFQNIDEAKDGRKVLPEEAVRYCISACFFGIVWGLQHLEEVEEEGNDTTPHVAQLKTRLTNFTETMEEILLIGLPQVYKEEAYLTTCDLLVMFSDRLVSEATLVDLVYMADRALQMMLIDFMQNYVFVEEDGGQDEHSKIEELHKRRNFLSSFCKLIMYNIIPTKAAADVFKYYVKHYNDYGDIIKLTLMKALEINKVNCARTMVLSLTELFKDLQKRDGNTINRQSEDFMGLKELAKRFALMFGMDAVKNREAITAMHREGILFVVNPVKSNTTTSSPPNLPFLEILSELTNKLQKQDKHVILKFLDRRIKAGTSSSEKNWQPLLVYRNSLVHGEADQSPGSLRRLHGRKRMEALEEGERCEDLDAPSDQELPGASPKQRRVSSRKERLPVKVTPHPRLRLRPQVASPSPSSGSSEGSISSAYSGESLPQSS